ncbi:hypothetical protein TorRG33x02_285590 [Trema orientale]|uniref:Rx N-terminal domain-containing protein n=1 Tax=Trema orientale TaxID=63057 RepID=A0A2P5CGX0_TREOI|nr:hypothetical protein TorRG33x02_285590 [Trema orientale]
MAETIVGLVIDKLISMLTEVAKLLKGVDKEVDAIKSELQSIFWLSLGMRIEGQTPKETLLVMALSCGWKK